MITCTIANVAVSVGNASFTVEDPLESRSVLTFTALDSTGTASYTRGEPVVFTDPGIITYTGYVQSDQPTKDGLASSYVEHVITCMDGVYSLGKRSNSTNYLNWKAGNIAVDFVRRDLSNEGITIAAAMHRDTTASDFNQGNLNGVVGAIITSNGISDDGDLELTPAGSIVTITENTTANFSTGTLTNVVATGNTLSPTTESAIQVITQLPLASVTGAAYIYEEIWSGSQTVGTLDTLNYDIWIDASSPAFNCGVDLNFSDGTSLHTYTGPVDQNALPASTSSNLATYAKGAWYTRTIGLTSTLNGKIVTSVTIGVTGIANGTYTLYVRNCYLGSHSGTPFFSTSATTTNVNPATTYSFTGFIPTLTLVSVVQAIVGPTANRISPAYSISAAQLVASSIVTWSAYTPSGSIFQLAVSYDGNAFIPCANGQPIPSLPAGSVASGSSLYFMEIFTAGTDPISIPLLTSVVVQLNPGPAASKTDIVTTYGTSTQWNTGTLNYLIPNANGDLTLGTITRDWNDHLITNQSFFTSYNGTGSTQSAASGSYQITIPGVGVSGIADFAISRLDFVGIQSDFVAEWDQSFTSTGSASGLTGFIYRTTAWNSQNDSNYGYIIVMNTATIALEYGSNSNAATAGTTTSLQAVSQTITPGTTYHFKVVVTGNNHQVYFNHATTPIINLYDSTYNSGYMGFYADGSSISGDNDTMTFDNLVVTPANFGTWTSPSVSLSSLSTIAGSTIDWLETLASGSPSATAIVQSSIDGGTTFQTCTQNTTIPNLTAGTNVSSKSLIIKITLYANSIVSSPIIGGLNWRVLGAFPTVIGTRDTAPLGNDMQITRTVGSGWGSAFDGQAWTQVGTATTAVATGEETITNTTGDVHMVLGSRTSTDEEGTMRFALSANTISAGMELRYTNANNYYRLAASTSALSIIKNTGGGNITLATTSITLSTGTFYWLRFRVVGSGPVTLQGKVWQYGLLEPGVNLGILSSTNPQWTVVATD